MSLVANMISSIKVACNAKLLTTKIQNSKFCALILSVLYKLGYIRGFIVNSNKTITVLLKYSKNISTIRNIYIISTPGKRVYMTAVQINSIAQKKDSGFYLISTSKGVMADEEAILFNLGGEVILKIS
jgi:ribosomal protein S8